MMIEDAPDLDKVVGADEQQTFVSSRHPGELAYGVVFARSSVRTIAVAFLPLMVASLVAALRYEPILGFLLWGFPVALVGALLWTAFSLRRQICQIDIVGNMARLGSVHDVALRVERRQFVIVFDARNYGTWMSIAAGDADYIALRDEWPEYNKLHDALINAIYRYGS